MRQLRRPLAAAAFLFLVFVTSFLAAADQGSDFNRIQAALRAGDVLEAQGLLENFLEEYPSGRRVAEARYLLGQLYYRKAAYKEAGEAFARILTDHPDWEQSDKALYGLAMSQVGMLNYSSAARSLSNFLTLHPKSELRPDVLYWLGEAYYRWQDYAAALERFEEFLKLYPDHSLCEYALDSSGWCLEQLNRHADAVVRRREFLNRFRNSSFADTARYCLAGDLLKAGKKKEAADLYVELAKAETDSTRVKQSHLRAGFLLAETGRIEEAVGFLENVAAATTGNERRLARAVLANCHLKAGDYQKAKTILLDLYKKDQAAEFGEDLQVALALIALGEFSQVTSFLSSSAVAQQGGSHEEVRRFLLGASWLNQGQYEKTVGIIDVPAAGKKLSQRAPDLLFSLAAAYLLLDQFDQAEPVLELLCGNKQFSAKMPQVHYYYGRCLFKREQYVAAKEQYEKFLESGRMNALDVPARYLLAESQAGAGELEQSLKSFRACLEKSPEGPVAASVSYQAGLMALMLRKYDAAVSLLMGLVEAGPSGPAGEAARHFAGIAYLRSGDPEKAARMFGPLIGRGPNGHLSDRTAIAYGLAEFGRGNLERAEAVFRELPLHFADTEMADSALFFAAASQFRRGLFSSAGIGFRGFAEVYSSNKLTGPALLWAAICEEKLNHPENALVFYQRALQKDLSGNERAAALAGRISACLATGDSERALTLLSPVAEDPEREAGEYAEFWAARLQYSLGHWMEAREALAHYAKGHPASPLADDALFFSGRAARMGHDYGGAISLYNDLNRLYPGNPFTENAAIELAECMLESGEVDGAVVEFERFIERNVSSPLRPVVLYDLGKALQRSGRFEQAIEQFKAVAGGNTGELAANSRFAIAECLAELDRSDEAVAELVGMVRGAYPRGWPERAQLQVARLLEREGQLDEARHLYEAVAQTYRQEAAGMVAQRAIDRLNTEKMISAR